ncbi:MAG: PspC domain-containing protein [Bacteroidota bacterium]
MKEGLYRSRRNRIFGGVAGGLGEYLNIDPVIIRVIFVVSIFLDGIGILLYIILWIVVPEENIYTMFDKTNKPPSEQAEEMKTDNLFTNDSLPPKNNNASLIIGIILIIAGLFFLGIEIFSFLNFSDLFPIIAIGVGIGLIYNSLKSR